MRLDRHRVEATELAHLHECRLELRQRLHVGVGPHVLVAGEDGQPIDVLHRHDGAPEAALLPGLGCAFLALDRISVAVRAREAVFGRDQVGGDALRHEIGFDRNRRVDRPRAAGGTDADAAHRFDATANRHVVLAGHHLRRREVHRVETRGAEAVDLHARHAVAIARGDGRGARDVAARLADRIDAAENHVVDQRRVELVAVLDRGKRLGGEIERGDLVQRSIRLAAPARRANVIVDEGVGHGTLLPIDTMLGKRRIGRGSAYPPPTSYASAPLTL
jgi:hypothetical protein